MLRCARWLEQKSFQGWGVGFNEPGGATIQKYHGSTNYDLKWAEEIINHLGVLELKVFETGVDYMIYRGLVDPERLAEIGWSQGDFLTSDVTASTGLL